MSRHTGSRVKPGSSAWRVVAHAALLVVVTSGVVFGAVTNSTSANSSGSTKLNQFVGPGFEPMVSALEPSEGSMTANEVVTISGQDLGTVSEVTFAGIPGEELTVVDANTVHVRAPEPLNLDAGDAEVKVFAGERELAASAPLVFGYVVSSPVDKQLAYAFDHWDDYNLAEYGDLNPVGGDCMNFVSQTLIQRGWQMQEGWSSANAGASWAAAWGHVPSFDNWLRAHPELGAVELSLDQRDQVKLGDLVMFDWDGGGSLDHIQIVSKIDVVDGETIIKMVGHNRDSDYRDLDATITVDHPGGTGYFWSLP